MSTSSPSKGKTNADTPNTDSLDDAHGGHSPRVKSVAFRDQEPHERRQPSSSFPSMRSDASDCSTDPTVCPGAHYLDAQLVKDIVTEIVTVHVKSILVGMRDEQTNLVARVDAIWASMAELERNARRPERPPSGNGGVGDPSGSMHLASNAAAVSAASPPAEGAADPAQLMCLPAELTDVHMHDCVRLNAIDLSDSIMSYRQASKSSSAYNPYDCRTATILTLDVYNLDDMNTDQLLETNGLADPSSSSSGVSSWQRRKCRAAPCPETHSSPVNCVVPEDDKSDASGIHMTKGDAFCTNSSNDTTNSKISKNMTGMDALRAEQDSMLVARNMCFAERFKVEPEVPKSRLLRLLLQIPDLMLRVYGVTQWGTRRPARWYRNFVLLLVCAMFLHSMVQAVQTVNEAHLLNMHLSAACYALGGLVGALSLRTQNIQNLIGPEKKPLETYAKNFGFIHEWQRVSLRRFAVMSTLWLCNVLVRILAAVDTGCNSGWGGSTNRWVVIADLCSFVFISGLLAALTYCHLHVCSGLEMAVDNFCVRFFTELDVARGITEWNVYQAILRRSAHTIETSFLALNTSMVATLVLAGIEALQVTSTSVPPKETMWICRLIRFGAVLPPIALVLYTVFRAAAVTEKCSRVPALVNSWMMEERRLDEGRQYIVQYITNCASGFYVKGVRLSAFMAMKLAYLFGIIIFTCISRSMTQT